MTTRQSKEQQTKVGPSKKAWLRRCAVPLFSFLLGALLTLTTVSALPQADHADESNETKQEQTSESDSKTEPISTSAASEANPELDPSAAANESLYTDAMKRPEWLTKGSYSEGSPITDYLVVMSERRLRELDAEEELQERLVEAVHDRIDKWLAPGAGAAIGVDLDYVLQNLIEHQPNCDANGFYHQLVHWNVPSDSLDMIGTEKGEAYQYCAQLKLDSEFKSWVGDQWENRIVVSRTMQIGLIAASSILALGLAFCYFTVNHKTRGFYSGRLQSIGLLGLIVIAAVAWWLATRFVWL